MRVVRKVCWFGCLVRVVGEGCWFGGFVRVVGGDGQWGWQGVGRGLEVELEVGLKGGGRGGGFGRGQPVPGLVNVSCVLKSFSS
jgi:hypothetical protein